MTLRDPTYTERNRSYWLAVERAAKALESELERPALAYALRIAYRNPPENAEQFHRELVAELDRIGWTRDVA